MSYNRSIHTNTIHLLHHDFNVEMVELTIHQLLSYTGRFLVYLSLPYYLYATLHYEIWQICLFFTWWIAAFLLTLPFTSHIVRLSGLKHGIAMRSWVQAIFWLLIPLAIQSDFWLTMAFATPLFIIRALGIGVSLVSYDTFLSQHTKNTNGGTTVAFMKVLIILSSAVAPIIGGVLVFYGGLQIVGIIASVLFLASGIVLTCSTEPIPKKPLCEQSFTEELAHTPIALIQAELGIALPFVTLWVLWPIFLSFAVPNIMAVTGIISVSSLLSSLSAMRTGHKLDQQATSIDLHKTTVAGMAINLIRSLWYNPFGLLLLDVLYKANSQSIEVQHDKALYTWLREKNTLMRSNIRWFWVEVCSVSMLLVFTALFYAFEHVSTHMLFVLIFVASSMSTLLVVKISLLHKSQPISTLFPNKPAIITPKYLTN